MGTKTHTFRLVTKLQSRRRQRHLSLPENQRCWKKARARYRTLAAADSWYEAHIVVPVPTDPESWLLWQEDLIFFGLEEEFFAPYP